MSQPVQSTVAKIIAQFTVVLVLITCLLAFTNEAHAQSNGQISEQRIAGQVRSSIAFDREFDGQQINVHVAEQSITLSGVVDSQKTFQYLVFFMQEFAEDYRVEVLVEVHEQQQQQRVQGFLQLISF